MKAKHSRLVDLSNNAIRIFPLLICTVIVSGCIGPLLNHDTGRSLGKSKSEFKLMAAQDRYRGMRFTHGITENIDIGVNFETLNLGWMLKYAFLNQRRGSSFALKIGNGSTFGGTYYSAALLGSYKTEHWEPFANIRYTEVRIDSTEIKDADTGDVFATTPEFDFNYTQLFLGSRYWINERFALSLEAGSFVKDSKVEFSRDRYISIATDFVF